MWLINFILTVIVMFIIFYVFNLFFLAIILYNFIKITRNRAIDSQSMVLEYLDGIVFW